MAPALIGVVAALLTQTDAEPASAAPPPEPLPHFGPSANEPSHRTHPAARVAATVAPGLIGAVAATAVMAGLESGKGCPASDCGLLVGGLVLVGDLFLATLLGWAFHRLADGTSSLRWVSLGAFTGGLFAALAVWAASGAPTHGQPTAPLWTYAAIAGGVAAAGAGGTAELGDLWVASHPETEDDKKRWWH